MSSTDIILVDKYDFYKTLQEGLGDYVWDNIAVLFHGQFDPSDNTITIVSRKMTTNIDIIEDDPGFVEGIRLMGYIKQHLRNALHIFCCEIGNADGLKYLLSRADRQFNFPGGISTSTNITGNRTLRGSADWILEWNTKTGFIADTTKAISPILQYCSDYRTFNFTLSQLNNFENIVKYFVQSNDVSIIVQQFMGKISQYYYTESKIYGTEFNGYITNKVIENGYATVAAAKKSTSCNVSFIASGNYYVKNSIIEAIQSNIPLIVCTAFDMSLISVSDRDEINKELNTSNTRLITDLIIPSAKILLSTMYETSYLKSGKIGIVSRNSYNLMKEAIYQTRDLGQSAVVRFEIDYFKYVLTYLLNDSQTEGIILVSDTWGKIESDIITDLKTLNTTGKPIIAYFGENRSLVRNMEYAGAIITEGKGSNTYIAETNLIILSSYSDFLRIGNIMTTKLS